jgi:hypothetical protein
MRHDETTNNPAVEAYHDPRINSVQYAEADAKGFAAALELGAPLDKVFLLSAAATKTSIESKVRQNVKALTKDDELFLFYAGHGFSKNGHNFLTCHDTDLDDLEHTTIKLKDLLDACDGSACKRIAFFLDSCESGITELPEVRGIYSTLSEKELKEFFLGAEYRVCFASCKTSEESHSSAVLKHGVWTYLVIQALEGNDRVALKKARYVTASSLQNYLKQEIPRTIRKVFTKPAAQTPWFYGSQTSDFVISDLDDVLKRRNTVKPGYNQVKQVFMQIEEPVRIASLSGFVKGHHRIPNTKDGATERFVENISTKEVEEEVRQVFRRIRNTMGYKRKDISAAHGRIVTPDFEYFVQCNQDAGDPTIAVMSRRLTNISPAIVGDDAFNKVFDDCFNELTFEFAKAVNLEDLIDQIEELESNEIELNYPPDCSYCDVTIGGSSLRIRVAPQSIVVGSGSPTSPKLLMESFFDVQKQLTGSPVLKAIACKS